MTKRLCRIVITTGFAVLSLGAKAQSAAVKQLDAYCTAQAQHYKFSGVVLVAKGPTVLYQKAFGLANRSLNIANTTDTKFQMASLTKQVTAALVLQLVDEGKLSLTDRLSKWYPDYPKGDNITVDMLLSHTSGIRNLQAIQPRFSTLRSRALPPDSVLALFKNEPFDFSPGTGWNYSNSGYYLLGLLIERATGTTLAEAVRKLANQLALPNTTLLGGDTVLPRLATGYNFANGRWKTVVPDAPEIAFSAGAMASTIVDWHRWQEALHNGRVLQPATYQQIITPGKSNYGYGLWIDSLWGRKVIRHTGSIPGFQNNAFYFPDERLHVIVLSNRGDQRTPVFMSRALAGIYFGQPIRAAQKFLPHPVTANGLDALTGRYETEYSSFSLLLKDGRFWLQADRNLYEWQQVGSDRFLLNNGTDTQLLLVRDANGKATGFRLLRSGIESPIKKVTSAP